MIATQRTTLKTSKDMNTIVKYNASNARLTPMNARKSPSLSMQERGQYRLNRALLEMLGAKTADGVEFIHDTTDGEWYVAKAKQDGLPLRATKNGGCTVNSVVIKDAMVGSAEVTSGRFDVCATHSMVDGQKCYAILFGSAKSRAVKRKAA